MAILKEIINYIEEFAPLSLQGSFDNCGLKVGNPNQEITGILVTLDTNYLVVEEALKHNCNLIIEHHPSIWGSISNIDYTLPINKGIVLAIKNDVAIYSAHTNVDFCDGGLNDYVARKIGLNDVKYIEVNSDPRVGYLSNETTLGEYANALKAIFNDNNVRIIGDLNKKIKKVAIVNGGGGGHADDVIKAIRSDTDVFVTGDVKYSVARLAKDADYAIIEVGHYNSEQSFMDLIDNLLKEKFENLKIIKAKSLLNPFN